MELGDTNHWKNMGFYQTEAVVEAFWLSHEHFALNLLV